MDAAEARRRIVGARIGRLATVRPEGRPHVVPICFAVVGDRIFTAVDDKPKSTQQLQRLANIRAQPQVALLVDHYEEEWSRIWWARADGTARVIDAGPLHDEAAAALREKYRQYETVGLPGAAIVIDVNRWSGWSSA